jgi:hypothetical protein
MARVLSHYVVQYFDCLLDTIICTQAEGVFVPDIQVRIVVFGDRCDDRESLIRPPLQAQSRRPDMPGGQGLGINLENLHRLLFSELGIDGKQAGRVR